MPVTNGPLLEQVCWRKTHFRSTAAQCSQGKKIIGLSMIFLIGMYSKITLTWETLLLLYLSIRSIWIKEQKKLKSQSHHQIDSVVFSNIIRWS